MWQDRLRERYSASVIKMGANSGGRPRLYIGRGSIWGNPHRIKHGVTRTEAVRRFVRDMQAMDPVARRKWLSPIRLHIQAGGVLVCHCSPLLCHGMALVSYALGDEIEPR